jgi:ribokinase
VRFVAVGDVMVDVVCAALPPPDGRVHAEISIRAGGSAVNAAAAAAKAGSSAAVVGRVGNDSVGELLAAELLGLGVEARLARDPDLPTGVAVALGTSVVANRGANARLSRDDIPDLQDADALCVSGFALFQSGSAEAARTALEGFQGWAGIDVGSPTLAASARDFERGGRTVLLASADEARAMTDEEPEDAVRTLASRFAVACVKLGEQGAIAAAGDEVERASVEPVVRRSPFGAGDAFGAALLVALAEGNGLRAALDRACAAGARAAAASRM